MIKEPKILGLLLILTLTKASFLENAHSSLAKIDGFPFQSNKQVEKVKLVVGGDVYDKIYFPTSEPKPNKQWDFETKRGSQIGINCKRLKGGIDFIGGSRPTRGEYQDHVFIRSVANTISVKVQQSEGGWLEPSIDCVVEALDGPHSLQFLNVKSEEIDSSEYGMKIGTKRTTCKCGTSSPRTGRIIGGDEVREGQYPWMVFVHYEGKPWCGGSIITEYHILTAAHCVTDKRPGGFVVRTGTVNNTYSQHGQEIRVSKIVMNKFNDMTLQNDIAILLLEEKIVFNDFVVRICLTSERIPLKDKYITAMGWGSMGKAKGHRSPQHMLRVHVRVIDYNTCNFFWERVFNTSSPDRICIYAKDKSICNGDSGGPLVWLDPEVNRYVQVALVSFGLRGCSTKHPSVHTDVAHYYSWIKKVISDTKPSQICEKKRGFLSWLF